MVDPIRSIWRSATPTPIRRGIGRLIHPFAMAQTRRRALRSRGSPGDGLPAIVGFFDNSSGIALSAQLASRALDHLGIAHRRIEIGDLAVSSKPEILSSSGWLFYLNAPELLILLRAWGAERLMGPRYGYWAWELPRAPAHWLRTSAVLDGIVAPSHYTAAALAGASSPITVTPHPLIASEFDQVLSTRCRRDDNIFRVVTLFDFKSSAERKNPLGALRAFQTAFGVDASAEFTIKVSNATFAPDLFSALRASAGANVKIVDGQWPRDQLLHFIASADVLISLHRAEGFGLTLAEAMMLKTPIIATAWSGNLDFMDEKTACLVPATLTRVWDAQNIYSGQVWARPDEVSAASYLRRLRDDPAFARGLAARARASVERQLSPGMWLTSLPIHLRRNLMLAAHRSNDGDAAQDEHST